MHGGYDYNLWIMAAFNVLLFGAFVYGFLRPQRKYEWRSLGVFTAFIVALDDKPYFKFTVGGDYTSPGGWYLNAQWMHGFFTERGNDFLHDYFIGKLDKNLFNDDVKVSFGGGLEIGSWDNISNTYGYGIFPELVYQAIDNLELALGAFIVDGKKQALFGAWKNSEQAYLRMKVNF